MVPRRRTRAVASSSPPSAATDEFCATGDLTEARAAYRRLEWTTSSPSSSPVAEGRSSGRRPAGGGRARRQRRGVAERVACTRRPHRSTAPVGSLVETPDGVPGRSHGSVSGGSGQDSASGRPRGHARRPPTVPTATGRRVARAARPGAAPSARPVVYPRAAGAPSGGLHGGAGRLPRGLRGAIATPLHQRQQHRRATRMEDGGEARRRLTTPYAPLALGRRTPSPPPLSAALQYTLTRQWARCPWE